MGNIKRQFTPTFKAKVALELLREEETPGAICSKHSIHPKQGRRWKEQAIKGLESIFSDSASVLLKEKDELADKLYKEIGKLTTELEWLKKKIGAVS